MKRSLYYLSLLLLIVALAGCGRGNRRPGRGGISILTPTSSGSAYEMLVVIDNDMWERPAGRALFEVLDSDVPGLPQPERSFRIMHTAPRNYDATMKLVRNIIVVDIQNIYTQGKFRLSKDVYAYPQAIVTIQAPDEATFAEFVSANKQVLINLFNRVEMNRQIDVLRYEHSNLISTRVKEMFDCDVWVSGELSSTKQGEDFFWAGTNTATNDRNYVIYSYPYTDTRTFTKEFFVNKRDSVMKLNIPGAKENSYMSTDSLMTNVTAYNLNGEYIFEARGLWRMKGDFMGGPYVSQARVDQVNQRVIVEEIFVYAPDKAKRNLVKSMEASLYTLQLPNRIDENTEIPLGEDPALENE